MPDHFDVIVIGSGAGGGTLTHALAPTGKRVLLLERGGWYPRERDNWGSVSSGATSVTATPATGSTRTGRSSTRSSTITWVATPRSTVPCCSASASATSKTCSTWTVFRPDGL